MSKIHNSGTGGLPQPPGSASWNCHAETVKVFSHPQFESANEELHLFLLEVTGRYLHCISDAGRQDIPFAYDCRPDAPGFLKLDVLNEFMIVGCDCRRGPIDRLMETVAKAFYLRSVAVDGFLSFVPVVVFGETSHFLFYVESMRGFSRVDPYFVEAATVFLGRRIIPLHFENNGGAAKQYINAMYLSGTDPESLVQLEPLISAIISSSPKETQNEMIRQIGGYLRKYCDDGPRA